MQPQQVVGDLRRNGALAEPAHRFHHGHIQAFPSRRRGHLEPDPAAAHDQEALVGRQGRAQRHRILDAAQGEDPRQVRTGSIQAACPAAVAQDQLVVVDRLAMGQVKQLGRPVDARRADLRPPVDVEQVEGFLLHQEGGVRMRFAREHRLGKGRPLVGTMRLVADQHDPPLEAFASQRLRGPAAGLAGTYDGDGFGAHLAGTASAIVALTSSWCADAERR
jgi:hypothetical protein